MKKFLIVLLLIITSTFISCDEVINTSIEIKEGKVIETKYCEGIIMTIPDGNGGFSMIPDPDSYYVTIQCDENIYEYDNYNMYQKCKNKNTVLCEIETKEYNSGKIVKNIINIKEE